MSVRVNHRGWMVVASFESDDRVLCVDLFERPDGSYGYEHFRADPEDRGRWTAVGGWSASRYSTLAAAVDAARVSVSWLESHSRARASLESWLAVAGDRD